MLHWYLSGVPVVPDAVFVVVKMASDPLQLSLESKGHNNTMHNTTKPINYNECLHNECVYQR